MTEEIGKVISDLYRELVEVRKQNVGLQNANEIYSKQNIELRQNQDHDDLRRQITELKKENILFKKDNHMFRQACDKHIKVNRDMKEENVKLVAQLENDEHNVGHLDEKMKRLDYLEKVFSENRYVFSDIPNTPENMKMVKLMKKHINKRKYTMRWRGQYLIDGEDWRKYTDGQPLSKSKCIRVYIDNKPYQIDNVEGFNRSEVGVISEGLCLLIDSCEENIRSWDDGEPNQDVDNEKKTLETSKQLLNYFESMRLHLENSVSTPIKDNVNIVIPKGDKQCHIK